MDRRIQGRECRGRAFLHFDFCFQGSFGGHDLVVVQRVEDVSTFVMIGVHIDAKTQSVTEPKDATVVIDGTKVMVWILCIVGDPVEMSHVEDAYDGGWQKDRPKSHIA